MNIQHLSTAALRKRRRNLVRGLPPIERLLRGSLTETYKGGRETVVEKFDDTTVKNGNKNITVDKEYNLKGERLNLKASGDIFIQVGGGTIHVDRMGNVTIKGTTVNINPPG